MDTHNLSARRGFLKTGVKGALLVGAGLSTIGAFTVPTFAADAPNPADVSMPGMPKPVKNEALFRLGVIGPATLSKAASKIGVDKATEKYTKDFAGYELVEAIAVTEVLTDLGTPTPELDAKGKETLAKLEAAPKGPEFDKAFMTAQLENHKFLRDHAEDYLKYPHDKKDPAENQTIHLATLALNQFKEHVAICKRVLGDMKA